MSSTDFIRTSDRAPRGLIFALAALLAIVTSVLFSPGLQGTIVYDDILLVERAPATQSISAAFAHWMDPYWAFAAKDSVEQRGLWRPLTALVIAVGRTFGGGDPFGFHLVSLLIHIAATWAAFRLAAALLRPRLISPIRAECTAAFVALLFAIHPAQVESVAWISAVNDPTWGLFGLLALYRYEVAAQRERWPIGAAVLFALALLAKEQAVVILPLALLLDLTAGRRPRIGQALCLLAPVALWYGTRTVVFHSADAGIFRSHGDFQMTALREISFRIELAGGFLKHTFWPIAPAVFRPVHPVSPEGSTAVATGALWLSIVIAASVLAWRKERRIVVFGLLALLIVIAPIVVSPASAGLFPLSDRYLYVGVFGASIAIAAWLAQLPNLLPLLTFGTLVPAALAPITWNAQSHFSSELAFRFKAVEQAPRSPNVLWGAGRAHLAEFDRTQNMLELDTAYLLYLKSLAAVTIYRDGSFVDDTSLPMAERAGRLEHLILETPAEFRKLDPTVFATLDDRLQATLGQITVNLRRGALAKTPDLDYPLLLAQGARQLWPDEPALDTMLAEIHYQRGELQLAKEALGRAVTRSPSNAAAYQMLGLVLGRQADWTGARAAYRRAVELEPGNDDMRLSLANAALEGDQLDVAERQLKIVIGRTDRKNVRSLVLRGRVELARGRWSEALNWSDRALAIDDGNGAALKVRGFACAKVGDLDGMLDSFARACEVLPDDFESHYTYAALMLDQRPGPGTPPDQVQAWQQVVGDALIRAYVLSPRMGNEQLLLQQQIEPFLNKSPGRAFSLATVLMTQNREVLALFWLQRTIEWRDNWPPKERSKNLGSAYTTAGRLYRKAQQRDDALEMLRNGVLADPESFSAHFELGDLLFATRDFEGAKRHLARALELFPNAGIAPEMQGAVKGTIEQQLVVIERQNNVGPPPPPENETDR